MGTEHDDQPTTADPAAESRSTEPGDTSDGPPDQEPFDPAAGLEIIAAQTAKVRAREFDSRLIFAVWGIAWFVGYLAMYLSADGRLGTAGRAPDGTPLAAPWAGVVFALLIISAVVLTIVHSVRGTAGIQGASATFGAMYGWSWCAGFFGAFAIIGGLAEAGASDAVVTLASNAVSCLVVGVLYMAGGAFWRDYQQYAIGVWILLVGAAATFAGLPDSYLFMSVLGGGGFFVGAILQHLMYRRRAALGRARS